MSLYCTCSPCPQCFKLLAGAGVRRIVYADQYRVPPDHDLAALCGVVLAFIPLSMVSIPQRELKRLMDEREQLLANLTECQRVGTEATLRIRDLERQLAAEQDKILLSSLVKFGP
jgi:hypothetical protein